MVLPINYIFLKQSEADIIFINDRKFLNFQNNTGINHEEHKTLQLLF